VRGHKLLKRHQALGAAAVAVVLVLAGAQVSSADHDDGDHHGGPGFNQAPSVAGALQSGATVTETGARWHPASASPSFAWLRCDAATGNRCQVIPGAGGQSYTVTDADVGRRLRVFMSIQARGDSARDDDDDDDEQRSANAVSAPTDVVAAAPRPAPAPPPAPPAPPPAPAGAPFNGAQPAPAPAAGEVLPDTARHAGLMHPVPVVRIKGRLTATGARVTLLTVRAPRGARITLRCSGRGCRANRWSGRASRLTRLRTGEGNLRAGTRLVISVTRAGFIGKRTVIVIRRKRMPLRTDGCLAPGSTRTMTCPSS
jgi:hypothetical protein